MEADVVVISEVARKHVTKMIQQKSNLCFFHLSIKKTGCNGYMYVPKLVESVSDTDVEIAVDSDFTILVPSASLELVKGTVIDYQLKQWGMAQLTFEHPDAEGVCGCGESFNFKEGGKDD
jgi:iron-sulfur cluster assembly protein